MQLHQGKFRVLLFTSDTPTTPPYDFSIDFSTLLQVLIPLESNI